MPLEIDRVDPEGTGYAAGLRLGDRVVTANDHIVRDPLEWRYVIADGFVRIEVERNGERFVVGVEKELDDSLGVHLKGPRFRKCNNRCIFCFVDQNPRGVRKPLLFKDEDFCLSFLYGNYVTLTNTSQEDLDRIIEQRLTPIYVSVHATEPQLRRMLLGNPRAPEVLPIMRYLADGGIKMHGQIVLMPGINDGEHLERTVRDLAELYPSVGSLCLVPVGLTKHRQRLPHLGPVAPEQAAALIGWQRRAQRQFRERFGARFVYLSDEFYLLAKKAVPSMRFYEGFPQVGNGVGMVRQFLEAFRNGLSPLVRSFDLSRHETLAIDLVTAALPARFLLDMVKRVNDVVRNLKIIPHVVVNERYGPGITVSGLLCGRDIENALKRDGLSGEAVLLPPNVVNDDMLFLDDVHVEELREHLGLPVVIGAHDLIASIRMVRDRLRGHEPETPRPLPVIEERPRAEAMRAV